MDQTLDYHNQRFCGLNASNVEELIKNLHPYAVDVSSGIETNGRKDKAKMLEFTNIVRNLE